MTKKKRGIFMTKSEYIRMMYIKMSNAAEARDDYKRRASDLLRAKDIACDDEKKRQLEIDYESAMLMYRMMDGKADGFREAIRMFIDVEE